MQPATRWFDESFAPILTFDERVAHQYRYGPPPEFPLASTYASIVHHLSGLNRYTHTHSDVRRMVMFDLDFYFHFVLKRSVLALAYPLNSLVRVSRRDVKCRARIGFSKPLFSVHPLGIRNYPI